MQKKILRQSKIFFWFSFKGQGQADVKLTDFTWSQCHKKILE